MSQAPPDLAPDGPFALPRAALDAVRARFAERLAEGLAADGRELRALPTFLAPPRAGLTGRALVVDTGGTNVRAAIVDLGAAPRVVAGPRTMRLPDGRDAPLDARAFWDAHAALVLELGPPEALEGLPLGFCFSYPAETLPSRDARLLRWTKGIQVAGVEGAAVGAALVDALARRGARVGAPTVVNDTVASLLAGAARAADPRASVGLIVGTGHNLASFFARDALTKLGPRGASANDAADAMAVNLEAGNFTPPHLTALDDAVDRASINAGTQRLEKAVSGFYLPKLLQAAHGVDAIGADDTRALTDRAQAFARGLDPSPLARDAHALVQRSADLVAAVVAGVIDRHPRDARITVLAEGGLFWGAPGYPAAFEATLAALLGAARVDVLRVDDANLFGAAAAALA
jgi:hexokinase